MNEALCEWMGRQADVVVHGEPLTAFRLSHAGPQDRLVLLERYPLSEPETQLAAAYAQLDVTAHQHAEAFAGTPQRYLVHACYGPKEEPAAMFVWRLCAAGHRLSAEGAQASEPASSEGALAMLMRHQEIFIRQHVARDESEHSDRSALRAHNAWLQGQLDEAWKEVRRLRAEVDDSLDRRQERELKMLQAVSEMERPERETKARLARFKPVLDQLGPVVGPALQAWTHAKLQLPLSPAAHPILRKLANAFEAGRDGGLGPTELMAMLQALPADKRPVAHQVFQAMSEAWDELAKLEQVEAAKAQASASPAAPPPPPTPPAPAGG
jgi:hypothetical protein